MAAPGCRVPAGESIRLRVLAPVAVDAGPHTYALVDVASPARRGLHAALRTSIEHNVLLHVARLPSRRPRAFAATAPLGVPVGGLVAPVVPTAVGPTVRAGLGPEPTTAGHPRAPCL